MEKISIVSLRKERNRVLETAALMRARKRVLGQEMAMGNKNGLHDSNITSLQPTLLAANAEEYSFDVVLSPEQIHAVSDHLRQRDVELESGNGSNHGEAQWALHPVIFRFNILPPASSERTLTSDDVCNLLNISRGTLYKYVKSNQLNCFRIGSKLRFLKQDVNTFMDEHKTQNIAN
ncbi:MAG: helix-turn-helix domain-containing protein [bacterium]